MISPDGLDPTKLIPEEVLPVRVIGTMTLDTPVDNVFAEIEQAAFCTQNIVPGIDLTNEACTELSPKSTNGFAKASGACRSGSVTSAPESVTPSPTAAPTMRGWLSTSRPPGNTIRS